METLTKPPLPVTEFKRVLSLIQDGDWLKFEEVKLAYDLDIHQFNALSDAYEFALKSIK